MIRKIYIKMRGNIWKGSKWNSYCAIAIAALLIFSTVGAMNVPPMPSKFYGTVKVDGGYVPDGTVISTWINGVEYANTTTFTYGGESFYVIEVPGDDPDTFGVVEGGINGDTVVFKIGSLTADQTGTWISGSNVELNLTATTGGDTTPPTWDTTVGIQSATDTGNGGEVMVTYGTATDANSPPVKYNVYYSTSSPATAGTKLSNVGPSPYTVTGLTNGQMYYFTVRVEDSAIPPNEDTNTVEKTATPTGPPGADIDVEKKVWDGSNWVDSITAYVGDNLDFKITVTNIGNVTLTNVNVSDNLPSFLKYNYDGSPTPSYESDHQIKWYFSSIGVGSSKVMTFSAKAVNTGNDNNEAVTCSDVGVCDFDAVLIIIGEQPQADIDIDKKVWNGQTWVDSITAYVGNNLEFRITVTNTGMAALPNVWVKDELPSFLEYNYDGSPTPSYESDHRVKWHFSSIGVGSSEVMTFSAKVIATGSGVNEVITCSCATVGDFDTVKIIIGGKPPQPDIDIDKKVWNGQTWVDSIIVYIYTDLDFRIIVSNTGSVTLTNVNVTDNLPSFLKYNYDGSPTPSYESNHQIKWHFSSIGVGGSEVMTFSAKIIFAGSGINEVVTCSDVGVCDYDTVQITDPEDTTPPTTTHEISGTIGNNGWYISNVSVELNATDGESGVNHIMLRLDGATWDEYHEPFSVTENGQHTLDYYSIDYAGNEESIKSVDFKIDEISPITHCELSGTNSSDNLYVGNVTVNLTAEDGLSGINYTNYKINEGQWQNYHEPFVIGEEGHHTVYYYSVDNASNMENQKSTGFEINKNPIFGIVTPKKEYLYIGDIEIMPTLGSTIIIGRITIEVKAIFPEHQTDRVEFYIDDKLKNTDYTGPYEWLWDEVSLGIYSIKVIAYDNAGNNNIDSMEVFIINF